MATTFRLPNDGNIYADKIFTRCRDLISYHIWSGLQRPRLDAWIANFRTAEERYFAARILDALIYRSSDQTIALLRQLFCRVVPDYCRINALPQSLQEVYVSLRDPDADPRVRIAPLVRPGIPPIKGASIIGRHLRRALGICERWFIDPQYVISEAPNVDAIIFVDDFLGTGLQATTLFEALGITSHLSKACFLYCPLAAHQRGVESLRDSFPMLHIATVECLDDSHAFFHADAGSFPDGTNTADSARQFYYDLLSNHSIAITGPDRRGFGHFEIIYAFEHAIPDNSLPLLWWADSADWRPLFDR